MLGSASSPLPSQLLNYSERFQSYQSYQIHPHGVTLTLDSLQPHPVVTHASSAIFSRFQFLQGSVPYTFHLPLATHLEILHQNQKLQTPLSHSKYCLFSKLNLTILPPRSKCRTRTPHPRLIRSVRHGRVGGDLERLTYNYAGHNIIHYVQLISFHSLPFNLIKF